MEKNGMALIVQMLEKDTKIIEVLERNIKLLEEQIAILKDTENKPKENINYNDY